MTDVTLRKRSEIPVEYTWNAPSVFPTDQDWERAVERLQQSLPAVQNYRGRLGESPETLLAALTDSLEINQRAGKILVYATLNQAVNTGDPQGARMAGTAWALFGQINGAFSFYTPEILAIGQETLNRWMESLPDLKIYAHYFQDLFRKQAHVRSAEVEEILGTLTTPFSGAHTTASVLTDADFHFRPARASQGAEMPVNQGTIGEILGSPDRAARREGWESYSDTHLDFKNTLASNLNTSIQQNVFLSRARRHASTLEASLFENNIPAEVFHNMLDVFQRYLGTWHRYWRVRRKALGLETLHTYDIFAPLTKEPLEVPYLQAVDWVTAALGPMGADYVHVLREGCLRDRWIDVYPSEGKSSSQFSAGWPGTHPFIFLNYDNTIFSASTLAHELGHSMHSFLSWTNQPLIYSQYSLFAAEVASNFHQAMLRAYLLKTNPDPVFQINVIEEAMSNFHRYFFIMPILARFELEMHERAERGEGLTAQAMNERMASLFAEGYGSEVHLDPERDGITWATFSHLYEDYYVFQYATGISAANALSSRVLTGEPGAVENYLGFLKSGSSLYPLDALKAAGVDLSRPEPVEEAFKVLSGLVDRLEKLVS